MKAWGPAGAAPTASRPLVTPGRVVGVCGSKRLKSPRPSADSTKVTDQKGLTPEEDDELRRVAFLAQFGNVAEHLSERFRELRARDRRAEIRDPVPAAPPKAQGPRNGAAHSSKREASTRD